MHLKLTSFNLSVLFPLFKREQKLQSARRPVAHRYGASERLYGILDNRQAESGATHLTRTPGVNTVEPLEQMDQMLVRHPDTIVIEREGVILGK